MGVELSERERIRYDRQLMMPELGERGQKRLKRSKVLVAGAGGLGSPISIYLAVAGVGRIRIVDKDKVELSNLNRQILLWDEDVGRPKVEVASEKLKRLNPDVEIEALEEEITRDNVIDLAREVNVIVDAMDNFPTRFILNEAAVKLRIPLVHGAIYGLEGRATTIIPGETACLRCIYREPPPREVFPVMGVAPALIGIIEATETIKCLANFGELLKNRLLVYDGEDMSFKEVIVSRNPNCPVCGKI
jgi:adenylyltransferase/sulfurtransferase